MVASFVPSPALAQVAAPSGTPQSAFSGTADATCNPQQDVVGATVEFGYRKYVLSFTAAPRRVAAPGETTLWHLQYGATFSYTIMPRPVVSAGYLRTRDGGQVEQTFGTAFNYVLRY